MLCENLKKNLSLDKALETTYFSVRGAKDLYKQWLESVK
jgi:hypothetical protein